MASGLSVRFKSKQQESKLLWVYINHHLRAIKFRAEFTFDQNKNCLDVRTFGWVPNQLTYRFEFHHHFVGTPQEFLFDIIMEEIEEDTVRYDD